MKDRSKLFLILTVIVTIALGTLSYFGIGSNHLFGVGNIKQGLDLKGGVSIVYEADVESPTKEAMDSAIALLQRRLDRKNYTEAEVGQQGSNRIRVDIPGVEEADAKTAADEAKAAEDAKKAAEEAAKAAAASPSPDAGASPAPQTSPAADAVPAATIAATQAPTEAPTETPQASPAPTASTETAEAPATEEPKKKQSVASIIGQTALLQFVDEAGKVILTGKDVARATKQAVSGATGAAEIVVALEFTEEGKKLFEEGTANNIGKRIYILLDDMMVSAPTVNEKIEGGNATISGGFTADTAEDLASLIREGSLPFGLKVISEKNVGAKLGANALSSSILAGVIGSIFVLIFMFVVYKVAGLAADLALFIYISLLLIFLSLFGVTLTLPGIAGIILSIGMAVDANVIIFERLKEEIRFGRSIRAAIDAAFKRAFPPILDSNVTTLISAAVLYWLGTGPIKGFAMTLAIGVLLSMFSALTVTKFILNCIAYTGISNPKLFVNAEPTDKQISLKQGGSSK